MSDNTYTREEFERDRAGETGERLRAEHLVREANAQARCPECGAPPAAPNGDCDTCMLSPYPDLEDLVR